MRFPKELWIGACLITAGGFAHSESVSLVPAADTTLFETSPDHNLGASTTLVVGTTAKDLRSRALLRFDLSGRIPAGAVINAASLNFQIEKSPPGPADSNFELRRVLAPWTEGDKSGSLGSAAGPGEATWNVRQGPATLWGAPGGLEGIDYAATIGATLPITGSGAYTFVSSSNLVADVQFWLERPEQNFGWLCRSQAESTAQTARRIASREAGAQGPMLTIEYTLSAAPLTITGVSLSDGGLLLSWSGGKPAYQLQSTRALGTTWTNVGGALATNSASTAVDAPYAFFRVVGAAP
jgi:hypothetical protein